MVLWYYDTVVWCYGTVVLWCGVMVQWYCGVVLWYSGTVVWCYGTVVLWCGVAVLWYGVAGTVSSMSPLQLPAEESEGRPPITIKFEIPYFTMSGIQVRYLKIIEKSGYQALPWVRYITKNGGEDST